MEDWQHAGDLGLWWDILEVKVGGLLIATSPQVCTVHKQFSLWWWVTDLRGKKRLVILILSTWW